MIWRFDHQIEYHELLLQSFQSWLYSSILHYSLLCYDWSYQNRDKGHLNRKVCLVWAMICPSVPILGQKKRQIDFAPYRVPIWIYHRSVLIFELLETQMLCKWNEVFQIVPCRLQTGLVHELQRIIIFSASEFYYIRKTDSILNNSCLLLELEGSSILQVSRHMVRCLILVMSKDSRNKLGGIFNKTFWGPKVWGVSDDCLITLSRN